MDLRGASLMEYTEVVGVVVYLTVQQLYVMITELLGVRACRSGW